MTTDAAGRLWIAHWGGACVTCHDPETRRRTRAASTLPTRHVTNCAFGGPDLRTLFITSARQRPDAGAAARPSRWPADCSRSGWTSPGLEAPRFAG